MNHYKNLVLYLALIVGWTYKSSAQEPHWVKHHPPSTNTCLYAVGAGRTLQEARVDMYRDALYQKKVLVSSEQVKKLEQVAKNKNFTLEETFTEVVKITGEAQFIDGLSEVDHDHTANRAWVLGRKSYDFQTCRKPTNIKAGWRVLMPGAAQYHKRQRGAWKWIGGLSILAGASWAIASSQAHHYNVLMEGSKKTPSDYDFYQRLSIQYQTGSRVSLAALSVLYGINIAHAFTVPGELQYSFFKTNHSITIEPLLATNFVGLTCYLHLN